MPLPTPEQIRTLGLPQITSSLEDPLISSLVLAADQMLASWCLYPHPDSSGAPLPQTLDLATYTLYLDGPSAYDERRIDLGIRPVVSVDSVKTDDADDASYSTTITSTTYTVDRHMGRIRLKSTATQALVTGYHRIQVVCTAGSDVSRTPALLQAIALQVAHLQLLRRSGATIQTVSSGQTSQTYTQDAIAPIVRALLAPYYLREREQP